MFRTVAILSLCVAGALWFGRWKYERIQARGIDAAAFIEANGMSNAERAKCRAFWNQDQEPTGFVPVSALGGFTGTSDDQEAVRKRCLRVFRYVN